MPHGGKRDGAGRKAGGITTKTREIAEAALAGGITPLDYMLQVLRDDTQPAARRDDMAKAAAPYVHPKLAAVEHSGGIEHKHSVADLTDEELAAIATGRGKGIAAPQKGTH